MARKRAVPLLVDPGPVEATGLFDAAWYLREHADVAASGMDALDHYARFGAGEGRAPNAYLNPKAYRRAANISVRVDPTTHYFHYGEPRGLQPSPDFDAVWYRKAYRLGAGTNALAHFLAARPVRQYLPNRDLYGAIRSGRFSSPSSPDIFESALRDAKRAGAPDINSEIILSSGTFDANHYLIGSSDVHKAAIDPLAHFCAFGWREGRAPNLYFDPEWYLATNPDVARTGINPLVHYVLEGETRGRRPVVYFDPAWYRAEYHIPAEQCALGHFLRHRRLQRHGPNPFFDASWYAERHAARVGRNRDPFAHFLHSGTNEDIDPSPGFSMAEHRRHHGRATRHFRSRLRPERDNPLARYLHSTYR